MSIAASRDLRRLLQVVDGPGPVGGLLEVVGQLGNDFLHPLRVQRGQPLADLPMQPRSATRQLSVIENLAVQCVDEFVALGHAAVGKRLGARPLHDVMPARQLRVEILYIV
jgi:hypothetical protein